MSPLFPLFEQSSFSMVLYDPTGRPVRVNKAFERLFGVTLEQVPPGYNVLTDPELERQGARPLVERAFRGEAVRVGPIQYETTTVVGSGSRTWTYGYFFPVRAPDGEIEFIALLHLDLTDQVEIAEELRAANEQFRTSDERKRFLDDATRLLNATLEWETTLRALARYCVPRLADYASVDLVDDAGEIHRVETAHVDPQMELVVRELWSRYPYRRDETSGVPLVLRTGKPAFVPNVPVAQTEAFARDAVHLEMLATLGPRSYCCVPLVARGNTLGALSLVYSDSGRVYTTSDLELAMELAGRAATAVDNARLFHQAEIANRAKADFLATMSHELRTPLNAIAGHAELLEMELHGRLTEKQLDAVQRIRRSQRHLLALVNDVLSFARIEAGTVLYDIREVSVQQLLADAESTLAGQLSARRLRFRISVPDPAPVVRADAEKVTQILLNLISNAVKFTEEGGSIEVNVTTRGSLVDLAVSDTGRGIPADKLGVIFQPFVQLERSLTRPAQGAGLGLAISRDLARAMGGDITAESTPGVGSTFTVSLPRAPARKTGRRKASGQREDKRNG